MESSYDLSVVFLPSSRSPSTGSPRTPILLRLFEPSSSFWVDCVFLFTHEKHSTRQYMLKVLSRYKTQSAANTQLSAPRFLPLCQHHKKIRPIKSRKRDIRKKNYFRLFVCFVCLFPGLFDG